jgi:hypothetical protein
MEKTRDQRESISARMGLASICCISRIAMAEILVRLAWCPAAGIESAKYTIYTQVEQFCDMILIVPIYPQVWLLDLSESYSVYFHINLPHLTSVACN